MTTTRWIVIGTAIVALLFVALLMGYPSETRTSEQNKNPKDEDKETAQDSFSWLDIDVFRPRLESADKVFTNANARIPVEYSCDEHPLRIAKFTLEEGESVRIVYELQGLPEGCKSPRDLPKNQELCLYSSQDDADIGRCDGEDLYQTGSLALGPGQGEITLKPIRVLPNSTPLPFKVRLD